MSERMTRSEVHKLVMEIRAKYGADIDVNFQLSGDRSKGQITDRVSGRVLSPRLSVAELCEWINGFINALDFMGFQVLLDAAKDLAELATGLQVLVDAYGSTKVDGIHEDYLLQVSIVNDIVAKIKAAKEN